MIDVVTDLDALNAITEKPEGFLTLSVKKDKTGKVKEFKGTIFMNAMYTIGAKKTKGWFVTTQDIPLYKGVADPADKLDKRNEHDGTREQLEMLLSKSGAFGQFIDKLDSVWTAEVERLCATKEIIRGDRKLKRLMQYTLSVNNVNDPNKKLDDPILRIQVDKGVFSPEYFPEFLRGQPKTTFLDFSKTETIKTADGEKTVYKTATITEDGKQVPVTVENMHKFIKFGAILKAGSRIMIPSGARSQSWISMPIIVNKAIIEQAPLIKGFSDEGIPQDSAQTLMQALTNTPPQTSTTSTTPTPAETGNIEQVIAQI